MNKLIAIPALALAVGLSLAACGPVKSAPEHVTPIPPASVALTPAPVSPPPPSASYATGSAPAPTATTAPPAATPAPTQTPALAPASDTEGPGALNPAVTQQTIHSTICISGWTGTVRPPESYTYAIKKEQLAARGIYSVRGYQEDHVIALELGGAPWALANLRPITTAANQAKALIEDQLRREVCDGEVTLAQARSEDHYPA